MRNTRDNYTIGIFDTPFCHRTIKNWSEKKQSLLDLKSDKLQHIEIENIITDYRHSSNKEFSYSEKIYEILKEEIDSVYDEFNLKNYFIRNSWMEVAERNMDHKVHNHGAVGLSVVCYIEYDHKVHTPTHFLSPFGEFENGSTRVFVPQGIREGSMIVFPSMLNHFTIPNNSDVQRTILSFNLAKKPEFMYVY